MFLFLLFTVQPAGAQSTDADIAPLEGVEAGKSGTPVEERIAVLIKQLSARYYDDRENAREELERIGAPAEPFLIAALKDPDFRVRYYAATVLGKIGSENCIEALVACIDDEDSSVVAAVRRALVRFGHKAIEALERQKEAHPENAAIFDRVIRDFVAGRVEAALQKYVISSGGAGFFPGMFDEIVKIGKPAVPILLSILQDPTYEFVDPLPEPGYHIAMRRLAADALGDMGDKSVIPELQKVAEGDIEMEEAFMPGAHHYLAEAAWFALYKLGDTSYVDKQRRELEELIETGQENTPAVRNALAILLCRIYEYEAAEEQLKQVVAMDPSEFIAHYNLACIFATQGKKEEALKALAEAVKNGYTDHEWTLLDGDLRSLHGDARFDNLVQEMKRRRRRTVIIGDGIRIELPEAELPDQEEESPIEGNTPDEDETPFDDNVPPGDNQSQEEN